MCFFFSVTDVFDVYRDSHVSTLMNFESVFKYATCKLSSTVFGFCVLQGRVWLIDLNPFGEVTDSLLFSWEELTSGEITQQQVSLRDTYVHVSKRFHRLDCDKCSVDVVMWIPCMCRKARRFATPPARWRFSPVPVWATESHGTLSTSPPEKTPTNSLTFSNW